ncbi:MAG: AAA family ATPase [Caulobacter sp.]|nr:AAA family ATPase [Caulobacter sp.]
MADRVVGDRYRLTRRILPGEPNRGVPEMWLAQDFGDYFYVKVWKRFAKEGADVQALWNREVRGLTRLQGYPGAAELFVRLYDLRSDASGFYAVFDVGDRELLASVLENRQRVQWLRNLAEFGRRRPLWEGLLRIAEALSILHTEGTLHRSLAPAAVFVDPHGQGQFRLSGFEWSLRVAAPKGEAGKVGKKRRIQAPELDRQRDEYSIGTDWFDFGLLAAELFGNPIHNYKTRESVRAAVSGSQILRESERTLILQLLAEDPDQRLASGDAVVQSVKEVVRELGNVASAGGRPVVLAVRLGTNQELTAAIERFSEGAARSSDALAQRDWIRHDLRGDIRVTARGPQPHYVLRGEKLEYRVRPFIQGQLRTWDIGFCESVEPVPKSLVGDVHYSLGSRRFDVELLPVVRNSIATFRDRASPWDKTFPFGTTKRELEPYLKEVHDFFRVTQQLETLLAAAQIWPVHVVNVVRSAAETEITVTPFEEASRNDLAHHLGLGRPSEQMRDWFRLGVEDVVADDDNDPDRDRYDLLEKKTVDSDGVPGDWRFRNGEKHVSGMRYTFRADTAVNIREGKYYLARNHNGLISQIKRRHRAIDGMRFYESLLRLLADPGGVGRDTGESVPRGGKEISLDCSKEKALADLWSRQPAFSVQGPPGTGKTTLIKAFAAKLFGVDPSAQILISAHSHHTVDDVRRKIAGLFAGDDNRTRPIILRLGAQEPTEHDGIVITRDIVQRLIDSPMVRRSPGRLQSKIARLSEPDLTYAPETAEEFRILQNLVQDSANVTLATCNSSELAALSSRGRRFDWSLIEEAGKAHGFDMASAMQVSHRLLFIGDHKQLPPYNAKVFKDLLGDPLRVMHAVRTGAEFAPGLVDQSLVDDGDDTAAFFDRCQRWRGMVTFFGDFFERSLGDGEQLSALAATLTDQHRMHPDIAMVVGRTFYPAENEAGTLLNSPEETYRQFDGEPPFTTIAGSWLPPQRVVWCDVPWIQREEFAEGEISGLFASDAEAEVVMSVLDQIRGREDVPCELQILSPYNDQLERLRQRFDAVRSAGRLDHMFESPFDLSSNKRMGATVDEFQGSEADIVIVSLVRNNGLAPWRSLGFLKEPNRMNVLLSRARHKLVLVGSWDFFKGRMAPGMAEDSELAWLGRLMSVLEEGRLKGTVGFERLPQ